MSGLESHATKPVTTEEGIRVLKNLSRIINREVLAGNPHAIKFMIEASRKEGL